MPTKICIVKALVFPVFMDRCEIWTIKIAESGRGSIVSDSVTLWTVAYQAPPSMGFSRQEYWSELPFSSVDLPDPVIEPGSASL